MIIKEINITEKAKKKISKIACKNNLDFEFVYYLISFYYNYDIEKGKAISLKEIDVDDEYEKRKKYISNKINYSGLIIGKETVINDILEKYSQLNSTEIIQNFNIGALTENCCYISEYAVFFYLKNLTAEKLNGLAWWKEKFDFEVLIDNLSIKLIASGGISLSNLQYLYADICIDLPYLKNEKSINNNWINLFLTEIYDKDWKLSDLRTCLKKFCKGDKYVLQSILEALSYSNQIKVENHPVENIFIPEYRNELSSHFYSNEWTYPLRFWND